MFITDDQPFLPVNPFADPAPTTMSSANANHHNGDDEMIDVDFRNSTHDRSSGKFRNHITQLKRTCLHG